VNGFNKIFFRPKPKYVNNAQTNTQFNTQTQAKPKPQAKPKAKPKPKIPRKPKSNIKKAFLKSFGVYTSTNKKLNINADKTCTGGEATIHDSEDGSYAKIFNNDVDLEYKKTIVEELNKMKLSNSIVTPKELLFDKNKNFIGYTMKKKEGIELGKLFLPRGMQHFPNYTLVDIIDLCITIINTYTEVHKQSIIVGDVNPRNILVYDKNNVSIIDSDSFQIGQPSPAYLEEYRRPRYYKKNILSYMRSKRDDTYSITILVFQLLIYGIHPYGGNDEKSIQEAKYIFNLYYPNKHLVTDKVLVKAYSRLSSNLKKLFYDVFKNDKYVLISTLKKNLQSYKQMVLKVQKNERRYKK
jgi:serine/threonine protein kinase